MVNFFREILDTDLEPLDKLADQWRTVHRDISGLGKRMHDEVLVPLKNKGYWEGAAAPYAWRMIDDIQRQLESATKVAAAVTGVVDDAVGELKAVRTALKDAVRRAEAKGLTVLSDGTISSVINGQCKVLEDGSEEAKAVDNAAREIADAVRRGIVADQNLAFALMADIGLGTWFNSDPKHSSIDTTNKISEADYNAFARALKGKDPYPGYSSDSPYDLGMAWVTGSGPRHREYRDGDEMTELIRASVSMEQLRSDTLAQWRNEGKTDGTVSYSISESGKLGALKKLILTDIPAIVTADEDHLGEAFMGSYSLDYKIQGQDPDGTLLVEYTLDNKTSNESFLHFVGYYDWLSKFNREEGAFSTVSQKITWTERVPANR
ncbi:hypothetical protein ACFPM3_12080 [Streptomyces coeruleoprunus]|uniref:WXG100 family type VII secretion target n=1 Tax=Streptomyces coeruleoprunus TaxID=285563 RepID=A0ABV9XCV7_9ACTN